MKNPAIRIGLLAALLLPALALAHTGGGAHTHEAASFHAGLLHPLTGLDHLAAMVALGLWSALALRRVWLAPAAFVLMLAVGAVAGMQGLGIPAIEPMIASSLLVLGLLVAVRRSLPLPAALALAGFFAFFHGAAHGYELASEPAWPALAGMLLATAALHGLGIVLGRAFFTRQRWLAPATGSAVALLGSALLLGLA
ncbi:MAG: HupE/UreJ family protein [Burkholderiaceae bacterium]|nr:HupE/UreJ family protein [Burkholderiaceae bacterium]